MGHATAMMNKTEFLNGLLAIGVALLGFALASCSKSQSNSSGGAGDKGGKSTAPC